MRTWWGISLREVQVGALPKADVPDGAVAVLFDRLHELHHVAGWPSLRYMAKEIGCSHTTVSAAFSEPRVPRWGLLELIVETLGGDTSEFHDLWLAASRSGSAGPDSARSAGPDSAGTGGPDSAGTGGSDSAGVGRGGEPGAAAVAVPPAVAVSPAAAVPWSGPPRQLPADVAGFTGRAGQLAQLDRLLTDSGQTVTIAAVSGTAGVGKTALAVHWGHRVAERFPDGQLYLNLRGYDPESPVSPSQALEALLRELGVDGSAIPRELPQRAARFRTLLADRRMLIVLDNAHSVEQVRDLLPGTGSCFALVTSRERLPALVARYGAVRINLDLLETTEAIVLLRELVGERVDAEPDAADALAQRCARLPLALRIAAELVASHPATPLARLVAELGAEQLDLLDTGDEYTAVRTVFSWSCRHLGEPAVRLFQLLGVHPGRDADARAAAALLGGQPRPTRRLLDELVRAHLVDELTPGRYGMHDLLRAYAAEEAAAHRPEECEAARERLYDHYLRSAAAAMDAAYPHNPQHRPRVGGAEDRFATAPTAREWLGSEWRNLVACAQAVAATRPAYTRELAATLAGYLDERARYDAAQELHELARATAVADRDPGAEGTALNDLALVSRRQGRYQTAISQHERALDAHREAGNGSGQARAMHGLGVLHWRHGRYAEAYDQLHRAVALHREVGDPIGEGGALYALGIATRRLGRYAEAQTYHRQAIEMLRQAGDRAGEAAARTNLGVVCTQLGRYAEAVEHHQRALDIHRETDHRLGQGVSLDNLGTAYRRMGRCGDAMAYHQQAIEIYRQIGYRVGEGDALRGLGEALICLGRYDAAFPLLEQAVAIGHQLGEADVETGALIALGTVRRAIGRTADAMVSYQAALRLAERAGDRYETARALAGIATAHEQADDPVAAREHRERAYALFAELGLPEADRLAARLATDPAEPVTRGSVTPGSVTPGSVTPGSVTPG
ncbi:MAG: tetratricopeptide repeat protein [Micromonosporaceae bacterium]